MAALVPFFVYCQALGAAGGALLAVLGEIAYARAIRDGNIDRGERAHLNAIGYGLRYGMTLLLVASIGLVVTAYVEKVPVAPALTASYWTFIAFALLIIGLTWALSRKKISFAIGSASAFSAWWFIAYLAFGRIPETSFGSALAIYVVATTVLYLVLRYARLLISSRAKL